MGRSGRSDIERVRLPERDARGLPVSLTTVNVELLVRLSGSICALQAGSQCGWPGEARRK
jgi:hypothetical protein